jgi:hypothetical protein
MPESGLSVLPKDLQKPDRITLPDLGPVVVLDVVDGGDAVWVTVTDGVRLVTTVRMHKLVPVPLSAPAIASEQRALRVLRRGAPWLVLSIAVAIVAGLAHAPMLGGQWALIAALWMAGVLRMVTTPERNR